MFRGGVADLPLHGGKAPKWLIDRMKKLSKPIIKLIIDEHGLNVLMERLSDPHWLQSLSCALGYDWDSSGSSTVVTAVLRDILDPEEYGLAVAGGKGRKAVQVQKDIVEKGEKLGLTSSKIDEIKYASRMSAKVDNAALQDGYHLYHHTIFFDERSRWVVVQQGLNPRERKARRYHWLSSRLKSFVEEPHSAIATEKLERVVIDLTAKESRECREVSVDLVNEKPKKLIELFLKVKNQFKHQETLEKWIGGKEILKPVNMLKGINYLSMPRRINWEAVKETYELQPRKFQGLLEVKGIGPATIRALALISALIYGEPPSWRDPAKFSFAHGGKDGVPYPVPRKLYDKSIKFLEEAVREATIEDEEKRKALFRLSKLIR